MFDVAPAARELSRLVRGVPDDRLGAPTPCADWKVGDLLAHLLVFSTVFTANARKSPPQLADGLPDRLPDDWRTTLPAQLDALATAWADESAWQGEVTAGGLQMSAEDNAVVAVEECVVHGWDLARATGQELRVDEESLDHVDRFLELFAAPIASGEGPYGPSVDVSPDSSRLDRLLGAAGRDPR